MMKKMKENKGKGFTLVELIVVLAILAILAALLIPALTGYIDRAKEKDIIAETRQTVMAAQTLVDEAYAKAQAILIEHIDKLHELAAVLIEKEVISEEEFEEIFKEC